MVQTDTTDHVDASALTEIKGVGSATAESLADAGYTTPREVVSAFLRGANISGVIPRVNYFYGWLVANADAHADVFRDHDVTIADVWAYRFVDTLGVVKPTEVAERTDPIQPREIDADDAPFISADRVAAFGTDAGDIEAAMGDTLEGAALTDVFAPADAVAPAIVSGEYTAYTHPEGGVSIVDDDKLAEFETLYGINREEALCHPDSDHPVVFFRDDRSVWVAVAPVIVT